MRFWMIFIINFVLMTLGSVINDKLSKLNYIFCVTWTSLTILLSFIILKL